MKLKVFYLETCSTCNRILKELDIEQYPDVELREIKSRSISKQEIEEMHQLSGSYESLFSRRAMKFRSMNLHEKDLGENDYKQLIQDEYTFLKRPVFILDDQIFIGNSKKVVESLKSELSRLKV